jgi:hypothetical protein
MIQSSLMAIGLGDACEWEVRNAIAIWRVAAAASVAAAAIIDYI